MVVDSAPHARVGTLLITFERQAMTGGTRGGMDAGGHGPRPRRRAPERPGLGEQREGLHVRLTVQFVEGDDPPQVVRIWSWLATVAEGAAERRDLRLAVRCVGFTTWWLLVQTPPMSNAAEMAVRLPGGVPDVPCGRLLTVGLRVIPQLPADELLIDDRPSHENTVPMRDALLFCAALGRSRTAHLAPDVADLPARVLSG